MIVLVFTRLSVIVHKLPPPVTLPLKFDSIESIRLLRVDSALAIDSLSSKELLSITAPNPLLPATHTLGIPTLDCSTISLLILNILVPSVILAPVGVTIVKSIYVLVGIPTNLLSGDALDKVVILLDKVTLIGTKLDR